MRKFTVEMANKFFEKLGLNVKVILRGKTLTIGEGKFVLPAEDLDISRKIKWDDKVSNHLVNVIDRNLRNQVNRDYEKLLETLKNSPMRRLYEYTNYGPYEPDYIRNSIKDMKAFLEMIEQYPEFNEVLDKYEACRILVDRQFARIENE